MSTGKALAEFYCRVPGMRINEDIAGNGPHLRLIGSV
jgi:hypothetical protein